MKTSFSLGAAALTAAILLNACGGGQSGESLNASNFSESQKSQVALVQDNSNRISVGANHVLAVDTTGIVYAWGDNSDGQLGSAAPSSTDYPVTVLGMSNIQSVKAGYTHSVALAKNGLVFGWGENSQGAIGTGNYTLRATPIQVVGMSNVKAIAAGQSHTEALRNDGTVWAWGNMGAAAQAQPQMVAGLSNVKAISAGGQFAVALRTDGTVWAWGNNAHGQLGTNRAAYISTPVLVVGLSNAVAIAAGDSHVVAMKDDGSVWAWGLNANGQLGLPVSVASSTVPKQIAGAKKAVSISAGFGDSALVDATGKIQVLGDGTLGQTGNGKTVIVNPYPINATLLTKQAYYIGFGSGNAAVLLQDGTVQTFGKNTLGQLGDKNYLSSFTPMPVSGVNGVNQLRLGFNAAR
ncbi:MAG TPA: hypothetical protein VIF60_21140 [Burkholderiaceae bacterium]|jgi:alpha-tubulin suppressor-like RCC1 family protein